MLVMQYASEGNLLSYLNRNINKLTWRMKLQCLRDIADSLLVIHSAGLVHCDLHAGNIVLDDSTWNTRYDDFNISRPFICDLGLSQSEASESHSATKGVLPFIAPEVFCTRKFTQKSDIYAFGIIVCLIASGEPPFRDREFDRNLLCDILGGLRPAMPESAPEAYKNLTNLCCETDPNKRPGWDLSSRIANILDSDDYRESILWDDIYYNDVKPLSRLEKESKYSSKVFPTGDSFAGMKIATIY